MMDSSPCLIRGHQTYSLPGGWSLTHPSLPGQRITGKSPEDAILTLQAHLRVNNIAASIPDLWNYANPIWGMAVIKGGEPERWMGGDVPMVPVDTLSPGQPQSPALRRILSPKDTGPSLWGTLHLIPLIWSREAWNAHIATMTRLIEPGPPYDQGCDRCANHWRQFRASNPPESITTPAAAAKWSLDAHNSASSDAANPQWTWRQAAEKWGWPAEWEVSV